MTTTERVGQYSAVELEAEHTLPKKGNCPTCGNPWEKAARCTKVAKLVEGIDRELGYVASGKAAEAVADQLQAWPLEAWSQLATKVRILSPSSVTINDVIAVFRERAASSQKFSRSFR